MSQIISIPRRHDFAFWFGQEKKSFMSFFFIYFGSQRQQLLNKIRTSELCAMTEQYKEEETWKAVRMDEGELG